MWKTCPTSLYFDFSIPLVFSRLLFFPFSEDFQSLFRWFRVLVQPSTSRFTIISQAFIRLLASGPPSPTFCPLAQICSYTPLCINARYAVYLCSLYCSWARSHHARRLPLWLLFLYPHVSDVHQHTFNRSRVATLL